MKNTITRNESGTWTLTQTKDGRSERYYAKSLATLLEIINDPQF